MSNPTPNISIKVDPQNPGQFFACCGLLELADRLSPGAEGWFEPGQFHIRCGIGLEELIGKIATAPISRLDPDDLTESPILAGSPFDLRIDWWKTESRAVNGLKTWAGRMDSYRIAKSMKCALADPRFQTGDLFDIGCVVHDPDEPDKKVEPFYFDARRGPNAHSRDVGFSPNDLQMTTTAFPAGEFLCLVGLQRAMPVPTDEPRIYDYSTWMHPAVPATLAACVAGYFRPHATYRFESAFRTGQKKHKAFLSAKPR